MTKVRIGKSFISFWLVVALLVSGVASGALTAYLWPRVVIPFEIKEPIEILSYTPQLSLFPGETKYFNATVENHAHLSYNVTLKFKLSDSAYQAAYVTFSSEVYTVAPGQQNLTAWITVSPSAPAISCSLVIDFKRGDDILYDHTLVAYWPLDETVEDLSRYANHGEIRGNPEWVEGKIGKALQFDGVDDFVFVQDSNSLDVVDEITLMAWIRPAAIPYSGERKVVYKGDAYIMKVMNSKISCDVNVNGWIGSLYDAQVTPLDEWYHVAVVYDGAAEILYVNAVEVDRRYRAGKITVTSKHLGIGAIQKDFYSNPYGFFSGIIDEIKIYSRAMDAVEIRHEMVRAS